jgi:FkbM family methyltransferase
MALNLSAISNGTLIGRWLRVPLRLIPRTAVVPIVQGPLRGKKWIVGSGTHGCWLGSYEHRKQQQFVRAIKPGDVVYDVGANAGFYSLLAGVLVGERGHIYSFEPLQDNVRNLRKHLEMNRVTNCTVMEMAASSADGEALFDPSSDRSMAHLSTSGSIRVRTSALDTLVSRKEIRPPDFMKIDIEGAEYDCLRGCAHTIQTFRPILFLATHGQDVHDACFRQLIEWEYEVGSLDARPVESTDELIARSRNQ